MGDLVSAGRSPSNSIYLPLYSYTQTQTHQLFPPTLNHSRVSIRLKRDISIAMMRHIRVVEWRSVYDSDDIDFPDWEHAAGGNHQQAPTRQPQTRLPAFTDGDFPRLSNATSREVPVPEGFWPNETWSDVARFDRFRKFRNLPLEIRLQIFSEYIQEWLISISFLLTRTPVRFFCGKDVCFDIDRVTDRWNYADKVDIKYPWFLPPICFASKDLYFEATPVLISHIMLLLNHARAHTWLNNFLNKFTVEDNEIGFNSVRSLTFDLFHECHGLMKSFMARKNHMQLVQRCPGLTFLKLSLDITHLVTLYDLWDYPTVVNNLQDAAKDIKKIVKHWRLEDLFECRCLRKLVLGVCLVGSEHEWENSDPDTYMQDASIWNRGNHLREWIRSEFWTRQRQAVDVKIQYLMGPYYHFKMALVSSTNFC